jgi:hypothetical protein
LIRLHNQFTPSRLARVHHEGPLVVSGAVIEYSVAVKATQQFGILKFEIFGILGFESE